MALDEIQEIEGGEQELAITQIESRLIEAGVEHVLERASSKANFMAEVRRLESQGVLVDTEKNQPTQRVFDSAKPGMVIIRERDYNGSASYGESGKLIISSIGELEYTDLYPTDAEAGDIAMDLLAGDLSLNVPGMLPKVIVGITETDRIIYEQEKVYFDEYFNILRIVAQLEHENASISSGVEYPHRSVSGELEGTGYGILSFGTDGIWRLLVDVIADEFNATIHKGKAVVIDAFTFELSQEHFDASKSLRDAADDIKRRMAMKTK